MRMGIASDHCGSELKVQLTALLTLAAIVHFRRHKPRAGAIPSEFFLCRDPSTTQ